MTWLLRNWHLKLGALGLAMVLYTGFVYSGSFSEQTFPGVPVQAINQPDGAYPLTQQLGTVDIRYRLSADAPSRVTAASFAVTVDLASYDMDSAPEQQPLRIQVTSLADGLEILSHAPTSVPVAIDRLASKEVPVQVERGTVPAGLSIGNPAVSSREVTASGPESQLGRVVRAEARVQIFESGIDVRNQAVTLVPVDIDGRQVESVELDPSTVSVDIEVNPLETSKTVRVRPQVSGTPATGFEIVSISVDPTVVTLLGDPGVLSEITEVATAPLSVNGLTSNATLETQLAVPDGMRVAAGTGAATVSVEVQPATATRTFLVAIECTGASGGSACLPRLPQLSLVVRGSAAVLAGLDVGDLTAIVSVAGLPPGNHDLQPSVTLPDGVELVSLSPGSVPVSVVPPATPPPG